MNPYLTEKAEGSPGWHKPVFGLMLFMTGVLFYVDIDFLLKGDISTAVVGLGLTALCAWPVIRIAVRWVYGARARQFADVFQQTAEESVPLTQLESRARMRNAEKWFHRLLEKRYLQNVLVDDQKRAVVLTAANRHVERRAFVQVECPNCGAKNQVVRGRIGRCAYCDSPLMAQNRKG